MHNIVLQKFQVYHLTIQYFSTCKMSTTISLVNIHQDTAANRFSCDKNMLRSVLFKYAIFKYAIQY